MCRHGGQDACHGDQACGCAAVGETAWEEAPAVYRGRALGGTYFDCRFTDGKIRALTANVFQLKIVVYF